MRRYKIIYAEGMNYVKAQEEGKLKEKTVEASSVTEAEHQFLSAYEDAWETVDIGLIKYLGKVEGK